MRQYTFDYLCERMRAALMIARLWSPHAYCWRHPIIDSAHNEAGRIERNLTGLVWC